MSRRDDGDIFGMALLDVVSCAFGAIVLLILISRQGLVPSPVTVDVGALLARTFQLEKEQKELDDLLRKEKLKLAELQGNNQTQRLALQDIDATTKSKLDQVDQASASTATLQRQAEDLQRTVLNTRADSQEKDEEVGGIPVDGDYVVFVIDTSGSMRQIWSWVVREMDSILSIHPQVKGFQILNDNGYYMEPGKKGRWIEDTRLNRTLAFNKLKAWGANSNSNPMQGIAEVFTTYKGEMRRHKVSLYVLGDDYTGRSYEASVNYVANLNSSASGKRLARIHALAFYRSNTAHKFATLMREMAYQNDGTFMALTR